VGSFRTKLNVVASSLREGLSTIVMLSKFMFPIKFIVVLFK